MSREILPSNVRRMIVRVKALTPKNQTRLLARAIVSIPQANALVFGCGRDSIIFHTINTGGRTLFVEDNKQWAETTIKKGMEVLHQTYPTKKGIHTPHVPVAFELTGVAWDFVLVDGPFGRFAHNPGRELPILWASKIGCKLIAVHDYNRKWERACCHHHLGKPDFVQGCGRRRNNPKMAYWIRDEEFRSVFNSLKK